MSGEHDALRDDALRRELLALAAEDGRVRAELAADGSLFGGYHPRMEAVHRRNAERLRALVAAHGWPVRSRVGDDGVEAAWLVVQHAIGEPDFLRESLARIRDAVARGEAPAWQAAMLEDRIAVFEGRPQRYGTQLEHDADGWPRPCATEDVETLDERRRAVGLEPMAERLARAEREPPPADPGRFARDYAAWLRRTGWRT